MRQLRFPFQRLISGPHSPTPRARVQQGAGTGCNGVGGSRNAVAEVTPGSPSLQVLNAWVQTAPLCPTALLEPFCNLLSPTAFPTASVRFCHRTPFS